jgi:hypothetical protein
MDENPQDRDHSAESSDQPKRRYGATRVFPRVEFGRQQEPQDEARQEPLTPEVIDRRTADEGQGWGAGAPLGGEGGGPFAPHTFGGGRVRVYGCSPGCLIVSVIVSLILTLLLNAIV